MTRLMMITPARPAGTIGGREQLSALHECCLGELLGDGLSVHRLQPAPPAGAGAMLDALGGRIDGVTSAAEQRVVEQLASGDFDAVWLDGSNLGRLAAAIKRAVPHVTVLTFCHNVEARFFLGGLRHRPSFRAAAILAANFAAERLAVRHSDRLIAMSGRDSRLFKQLYRRGADQLLPLAIADRITAPVGATTNGLLFVGGAFYANLAGMRWFAAKVAPHAGTLTRLVGRGFDAYRDELETGGMIEVIGKVDDLAPYYTAASALIAPIFDGSGMKTKVAEALMFGKPMIGTSEALSGYEEISEDTGWRADTPAEWIAAIAAARRDQRPSFDPALRAIYEQHYSPAAARRRIAAILGLG